MKVKEKTAEPENKVDVSDFEMSDTKQTAEKETAKVQASQALKTEVDEDTSITHVAEVLRRNDEVFAQPKQEPKQKAEPQPQP